MITYPVLKKGSTIGVTAPSSGVPAELHELLTLACKRAEERGYSTVCKDTAWTQQKARSADAAIRAAEFNAMLRDENIDLIIPPWGGELLIEILDQLDFEAFPAKWVLGYSDISLLLLAITLKTGVATAHGTNLIDLRRSLVQMKLAGWFAHCAGIMFGRSAANHAVQGYTAEDVYRELADELRIPVLYDIDCGHMPPQMTFVNGAIATVDMAEGRAKVTQHFCP